MATAVNGKTETRGQVEAAIAIRKIQTEVILVSVKGTAPLLVHRFSEKAKQTMLDAMQGKKGLRESKNPEAEYEASMYRLSDGAPAFPSIAFKAATVGGARFYGSSVTMASLKQVLFFDGDEVTSDGRMVRIEGTPKMREDVVRVGRGGTDLRYRAVFAEWSAVFKVRFMPTMLDLESVVSLIDAGGTGVGVGEWRPERGGDYGTYEVEQSELVA